MNGRKSTPEIGSSEVERPLVPFDIDTEPVRSPVKRIRPVDARGGIWSARKIRAAHGEREGGGGRGGDRDGYAPGKRWSPSTVGRKRKYWDWLSRTRDRGPTLGTLRECAHECGSFPSPSPPPSTSSTSNRGSATTGFLVLLPLSEVGTDSPLTRREPRCAIHFCPLTSSFPRLPLPRGFKDSRSEQWGIPFGLANNAGSAPTLPLLPHPFPFPFLVPSAQLQRDRFFSSPSFEGGVTPRVSLPPRPSYDRRLSDINQI